jgi:DNA-binding IclR family transcriptional regulator
MMHPESKHRPIEFSGDLAALAVTLAMPLADVTDAIVSLIERGHLERVTGSTWRLKPTR